MNNAFIPHLKKKKNVDFKNKASPFHSIDPVHCEIFQKHYQTIQKNFKMYLHYPLYHCLITV